MSRPRSSEPPDSQTSTTSTVLVGEDDDARREVIRSWLTTDGRWDVREASHVDTVVRKLDADIDVLVLEYWLPGLPDPDSGSRFEETSFDGRIVVLSSNPSDGHRGVDDAVTYLTKPLDRAEFLAELGRTRR